MRARRLQMGCNIIERNVEARKSEIWERHQKHIFMGAGIYDNKHGVGIMLIRKWRQNNIDTEYINGRETTNASN